MSLPRWNLVFSVIIFIGSTSCSIFSNDVDAIKVQCGTATVDASRSYVAVVDSSGRVLQPAEFASRWLDDSGSPVLNGRCIELNAQETRSLIVRSRQGSEGLIFAAKADQESLSRVRLEKYSYGPLHKTCDQAINTNLLNLGLPVSFEDHVASGYTIKATASLNGKEKQRWDFVNGGPAAPMLDLAALSNGRYALQFELAPLFSEGAVPQSFSCDLVIDRKAPQISLLGNDGGFSPGDP